MIIDCCPRSLQVFFRAFLPTLSDAQYHHVWTMALAIALNPMGSKLIRLAAAVLDGRHRTSLGWFLRHGDWDVEDLLDEQVWRMVQRMKSRPGEPLELLIDDTRIAKRGKKMACLQKIWDYKQQRFVIGHIVVVAAIRFRGVVFPWRVVLWRPKAEAGAEYRKFTESAAAMIASMPPVWGLKVRVMFDAFYLCPLVTKACEKKGFTWFSVAARNRRFRRDRGQRAPIGQLAPGWLRHLGRNVRMPRARGVARMRLALVRGQLSRIGNVRLVLSKRIGDPWKNMVAFVTNERGLDARPIVSIYEGRWAIEILFKELRNDLGLCDYQVLEERAIVRHLHLCCLSHLMLTHHAMDGVGAQARKANHEVALPPMSQRLEALRTEVRRDQIRRVLRGNKHRRARMRIERYFLTAA